MLLVAFGPAQFHRDIGDERGRGAGFDQAHDQRAEFGGGGHGRVLPENMCCRGGHANRFGMKKVRAKNHSS